MNAKKGFSPVVMVALLSLVLAACAPPRAPVLPETLLAATEISWPTTGIPGTKHPVPTSEAGSDLRPIAVEDVQVEIGVGSPKPVDVVVNGTWPDLCSQVALVEQRVAESSFEIDLLASPAALDCPPDQLGVPFRIDIPLNIVELPVGTYSVVVNGFETSFEWEIAPSSGGVPLHPQPDDPQPLSVVGVTVQVGEVSPIPVEVIASGDWPSLCSQLAEVRQQISSDRVEISLLGTPGYPDCPPDYVGIPFRVAVPLNMVEMPLGTYAVVVNGVESSFEWTGSAPEQVAAAGAALAYVGADGNLWYLDAGSGEPRQVTTDATPPDGTTGSDTVNYYFPNLSPDGRFLAARRDAGTPVEWGVQYQFGLYVYDTESREARLVTENEVPPAGFDWKPGTHLLAYGLGTDPNYFVGRGEPDPEMATGIYGVDLDNLLQGGGEASLLVKPERGYALMLPEWSVDGRFLSFDEIQYMEGRGMFAYYDFEAGQYISWEEPIGIYDWSPDSAQITYDRLTYTATGEERIFVKDRAAGEERQVSPEMGQGYAFLPSFSPGGEQIAYLVNLGGPETTQDTLYVQDYPDGEPRPLGVYDSAFDLQWTPDGSQLILSAGPYESRQIIQVSVADGISTVLTQGSHPTVAVP